MKPGQSKTARLALRGDEPVDIRAKIMDEISARMGPGFFHLEAPAVYPHDLARLQSRAKTEGYFKRLNKIYSRLPDVRCSSCADICCRESPDIYLLEYLNIRRMVKLEMNDPEFESEIVRKSLEWSFLRFVKKDLFCPFLSGGRCSIYKARPLNCRTWALEDNAFYAAKAERAKAFLQRQAEFLSKHNIESPLDLSELLLKKCELVSIDGDRRFTESEIADIELEIAFMHLDIIPRAAFRSANFYLNFPGFVALGKTGADNFESLCVQSAKEFINSGKSDTLNKIIRDYEGRIP